MPNEILVRLWLFVALVLPTGASAQFTIRGLVLDARGDLPLVGAHVRVVGGDEVGFTEGKGHFDLHVSSRKVVVRISYVGFEDLLKTMIVAGADGERTTFKLVPKAVELPVAEIHAPEPEVVFERKDLHVGDYLVNDDGVWVLVYGTKQLWHRQGLVGQTVWKDARLHLLNTRFEEITNGPLPRTACDLARDHAYRPVVKSEDGAWRIDRQGGDIGIGWIDAHTYSNAVIPWTDSVPGYLIGNTWMYEYPAFDHVAFNALTAKQELICSVVDPHWMAIFRSGYKYMSGRSKVLAMDLAMEHGTDPETIAGLMIGFDQDMRYRPPYAPLFVIGDTLCVFDHYKERIRRFSSHLLPIDEIPITYQRDREWDHRLVQDRSSGAVYVCFARGARTWLRPLDPATGVLGEATPLTFPWPEDVQVHDGYAYYVYRPYESLQKRTLYREVLR
ncbi:MAG: carboxypeptidase-like regulatory domain-containing protein [Flavobacteriales bacterium]|nr:carboxypeptidase-like regulatory domain-containing protein [Flavobacteriales bacterium]